MILDISTLETFILTVAIIGLITSGIIQIISHLPDSGIIEYFQKKG